MHHCDKTINAVKNCLSHKDMDWHTKDEDHDLDFNGLRTEKVLSEICHFDEQIPLFPCINTECKYKGDPTGNGRSNTDENARLCRKTS